MTHSKHSDNFQASSFSVLPLVEQPAINLSEAELKQIRGSLALPGEPPCGYLGLPISIYVFRDGKFVPLNPCALE